MTPPSSPEPRGVPRIIMGEFGDGSNIRRAVQRAAALAATEVLAGLPAQEPVQTEFVLHARDEWTGNSPKPRRREARPLRKCRLPRCSEVHQHNGGYCCADHCREHRGEVPPAVEPPA